MKHHRCQQETDTLCTTINRPRKTTSLATKMEIQIQTEQMFEHISGHASDGLLCYASKDGVSCLCKEGGAYTCCSICSGERKEVTLSVQNALKHRKKQ